MSGWSTLWTFHLIPGVTLEYKRLYFFIRKSFNVFLNSRVKYSFKRLHSHFLSRSACVKSTISTKVIVLICSAIAQGVIQRIAIWSRKADVASDSTGITSRTDVRGRGRTLRECKHMVAIARASTGCKFQPSLCFKSPGTSFRSDYCSPASLAK